MAQRVPFGYWNVDPQEESAAAAAPHRYGVEKVLPRFFAFFSPQPRSAATSATSSGLNSLFVSSMPAVRGTDSWSEESA